MMEVVSTEEIAAIESVAGGVSLKDRLSKKGCGGEQSVDILRDTFSWGHLCPTCPGK